MIRAASQTSRVDLGTTKRALLLRDGLTFLTLLSVTVALFGVTWFLFRSFESRRDDLAVEWARKGRTALQQGQPEQAISALRAALSYAPDDRADQLLLAQALADAGRTEEATNYFLNLWTARPGDGFINLQLARLLRRQRDTQKATDYYRAAIYGDWPGDAPVRRRECRLELVDYLIEQKNFAAARGEALVAAGNAPDELSLNLLLGDKLRAAADLRDALTYYRKAVADDPKSAAALAAAGRAEYSLGDYAEAHVLLDRAVESGASGLNSLAQDAGRLVELSLSRELPARVRAEHIVRAAEIAQARLNACTGSSHPGVVPQPALQELEVRWNAVGNGGRRNVLVENAAAQDTLTQLIFDTETGISNSCGEATGDDALLLMLAKAKGGQNEP